jgi:hypothetical protein
MMNNRNENVDVDMNQPVRGHNSTAREEFPFFCDLFSFHYIP